MIGRRGFLGILTGTIAAPLVVRSGLIMPVKALIEPVLAFDESSTFVNGGRGNTILTPAELSRHALRVLHETLRFEPTLKRAAHDWADDYDDYDDCEAIAA